jgi:hypothetical protein
MAEVAKLTEKQKLQERTGQLGIQYQELQTHIDEIRSFLVEDLPKMVNDCMGDRKN